MNKINEILDKHEAKMAEEKTVHDQEAQQMETRTEELNAKYKQCFDEIILPYLREVEEKLEQRGIIATVDQRHVSDIGKGILTQRTIFLALEIDRRETQGRIEKSEILFQPSGSHLQIMSKIKGTEVGPQSCEIDAITKSLIEEKVTSFLEKALLKPSKTF